MMRSTTVGSVLLVAIVALAVGGTAVAAQGNDATETTPGSNASFGAEISSFMQASTADTESEVDDGMFDAALDRTEDAEERRELLENRQQQLRDRQERLEEWRNTLSEEEDRSVRARAVATGVSVGATGLERSVNGTERVAREVGIDTGALAEIRSNARSLRGSEAVRVAGGILGGIQESAGAQLGVLAATNPTDGQNPPVNGGSENGSENGPAIGDDVDGAGIDVQPESDG